MPTLHASLKATVGLYALALGCTALVGPFGPCGPDSALGLVLFLLSVVALWTGCAFGAWAIGVGAFLRETRRDTLLAALIGALLVAGIVGAVKFTRASEFSWFDLGMLAGLAWPGVTAATFLIRSAFVRRRAVTS